MPNNEEDSEYSRLDATLNAIPEPPDTSQPGQTGPRFGRMEQYFPDLIPVGLEQEDDSDGPAPAVVEADPYAEFRELLKGLIVRNGGFRATARLAGVTHPTLKKLTETAEPRWRVVHKLAEAHPDIAPALYRTSGCPPPPSARVEGPCAVIPLTDKRGTLLAHATDPRMLGYTGIGHRSLLDSPFFADGVDLSALAQAANGEEVFVVPDSLLAPLCQPSDILIIARAREALPGQVVLVERPAGPSVWVYKLRDGRPWLATADGSHATPMADTDTIRGIAVALYRPGPLMVGIP